MTIATETLVKRFYSEVWNRAEEDVARDILHPNLKFRGSLGQETQGRENFIHYLRAVHAALDNYTCRIDDLVSSASRIAAQMTFSGVHRARFFDIEATGKKITWVGAAFFKIDGQQIIELWVLGDIDSIKQQLGRPQA